MIDLHLHLLPELDDGARSLAEAVELCRIAAADGCTDLVATPHRRRDEWTDRSAEELTARLAVLDAAVGGNPRLHLGAENRIDSDLPRELATAAPGAALPLAGSRYLLLELDPSGFGPDPVAFTEELVAAGWRPIYAHPELDPRFTDPLPLAQAIVGAGGALQLTGASVVGDYGRAVRERALALVESGAAAFVASDAHRLSWRPTGLSRARAELARAFDEATAERLTTTNPCAVLEDRALRLGAGNAA